MKLKRISALLLALVMLFALCSCGEDKESADATTELETPATPAELIVGQWEHDMGYIYDFKADGTGAYIYGENEMPYTYVIEDGTIVLTYEGTTDPNTFEYSVDGKVLTIKDSFGGDTIYNKK